MTSRRRDRARADARARSPPQPDKRAELIRLAEVFSRPRLRRRPARADVRVVEHPDKLHAFEEMLQPYGIKEVVRTGRIAMRQVRARARDRGGRMRVLA